MRLALLAIAVVASISASAYFLWPTQESASDDIVQFSEADNELLRYIPDDAFALLVVRSEKMFEVPGLAEDEFADLASPTGLKPSEIKDIVIAVVPSEVGIELLFSLRMQEPVDPVSFQRAIAPGARKVEARFPAYSAIRGRGMSFVVPEPDRIVMSTSFSSLQYSVSDGELHDEKSQLSYTCGSELSAHIFCAADVERLIHHLTFSDGRFVPQVHTTYESSGLKNLERLHSSLNLSGQPAFQLGLVGKGEPQQFREKFSEALETYKSWIVEQRAIRTGQSDFTEDDHELAVFLSNLFVEENGNKLRVSSDASTDGLFLWKQILGLIADFRGAQRKQMDVLIKKNRLRQVILAMHNYEAAHDTLPVDIRSRDGQPLLSWRVQLLPYLDEFQLYKKFNLDEPWDSEHNLILLKRMPDVFSMETSSRRQQETSIQYPVGKGIGPMSVWPESFEKITDGTGNTISVLNSGSKVPWTKPADHPLDLNDPWANLPVPTIVGLYDGQVAEIKRSQLKGNLASAFTINANDETLELSEPRSYRTMDEQRQIEKKALIERFELDEKSAELIVQSESDDGKSKFSMNLGKMLLQSKDPDEVAVGLLLLSRLEPVDDWKELEPLLTSKFDFIRDKAIDQMVRTKEPGVIAAIIRSNPPHMRMLGSAIQRYDLWDAAVQESISFLDAPHPNQRLFAGFTVASTKNEEYRGDLEKLLNDDNEVVRRAAERMLRTLADEPEE